MDFTSIIFGHLKQLQTDIKNDLPFITDEATKFHLEYLSNEIEKTLATRNANN
jgi:hypothetical protein